MSSRPGFPIALARRLARLVAPALAVALAISTVAVALHHHDDAAPGHSCAICVAGHAPAAPAPAVSVSPAPRPLPGRVRAGAPRLAQPALITATPSRAPPLA